MNSEQVIFTINDRPISIDPDAPDMVVATIDSLVDEAGYQEMKAYVETAHRCLQSRTELPILRVRQPLAKILDLALDAHAGNIITDRRVYEPEQKPFFESIKNRLLALVAQLDNLEYKTEDAQLSEVVDAVHPAPEQPTTATGNPFEIPRVHLDDPNVILGQPEVKPEDQGRLFIVAPERELLKNVVQVIDDAYGPFMRANGVNPDAFREVMFSPDGTWASTVIDPVTHMAPEGVEEELGLGDEANEFFFEEVSLWLVDIIEAVGIPADTLKNAYYITVGPNYVKLETKE